jgi:hypothetical protein
VATEVPPHDALLSETVAHHFPEARIEEDAIKLGFGDLQISCFVDAIREIGPYNAASLFFTLRGGRIGKAGVFASVSGYAETAEAAIITGACNWTCAFGPVFRAGLAGEEIAEVDRFEVTVDGQRFRIFVDGLDRAMLLEDGDATRRIAAARARFSPGSWLVRAILESGRLPLLHAERPTIISAFVSDGMASRTVEVKVNGWDWPGMEPVFAPVPAEPPGAIALLRELAVVVPVGPSPALVRGPVARTLEGLKRPGPKREAVDWPGWKHHGGELGATLSRDEIATLETRVGKLPADYHAFLSEVAAFGAGPGYGLMSPLGELQKRVATGTFSWNDESKPTTRAAGVIPIAHAGCGIMWLLVIAGPHAGEVWLDGRSSDGLARRVAPTFIAWYRDWLTAAVQNAQPWIQWESACCATPGVLSQLIAAMEREGVAKDAINDEVPKRFKAGALSLAAMGSDYFVDKTKLNPCQGCIALASRFHLAAAVFQSGSEPKLDGKDEPPEQRKGWLSKLGNRLRSRSR